MSQGGSVREREAESHPWRIRTFRVMESGLELYTSTDMG